MSSATSSTIKGGDVIDYALEHQCFHDHQGAPYRFQDQIRQLQATAKPTKADGLFDQPGLTAKPLPRPKVLLEPPFNHENYTIPIDPAVPASAVFSFLGSTRRLRLPSETIDSGYDLKKELKQYLHDVQLASSCNILTQWLPLSHVNAENDEALGIPSTVSRWQTLALRELEVETLASEQGPHLVNDQDVTDKTYAPEQLREILCLSNHPKLCPEPVSPPLSPASDLDEPFVPDSNVMVIDPTSEPSSPISKAFDKLQWDLQNGCVDSEPAAPSTMPSSPPIARTVFQGQASIKPSGLKIDVPLLSPSPRASVMPKHLTETLVLETIDPDEILQDPVNQGEFFEEAFQAILNGRHCQTKRQLEEERLNPTDALLRLPVPAIDFHISDPEWNAQVSSPQAQFKWLRQAIPSNFHLPYFEGLTRLEASLKWTPVPHGTGRVSLTETAIQLGPISRELLSLKPPRLCSRDYVTTRSRLMVLQVSADEDIESEVTPRGEASVPAHESFFGTLRSLNQPDESLDTPSLNDLLKYRSRGKSQGLRRKINDKTENLLPDASDPSTATSLLSSFIQLRRPKRLKTACSSVQLSVQSTSLPQTSDTARHSNSQDDTKEEFQESPVPDTDLPVETCRYIVSMNLSRNVLSHLEKSWQQLELIDRDFSQYNTVAWSLGSAQRKEVVSSLAFEADISLCPGAGLIMTTILKVKQKPLPGSTTLTPLRERVKLLSERYESLFILVSESNALGEYVGSPTVSDIAGYADFVRFTTSLKAGISTYLVSGSEKTLSKWALSIMCRYSLSASQFGRFLDFRDSAWELFFRRAGLNISAAQVITGLLLSEYSEFGLATFLSMNAEGRVSKYGQIMGGQRILNNVSRILDQEWV